MSEPRYGIWIPVYGNCGAMNHPQEPRDASYLRAKGLIQLAEECGFTTTLIAEHIINPRNQELDQLETWTAAAALAEATNSIEIIAAVKPLLFHPTVLAKMALGIDAISGGRFAINLVSAWFKPEMEKSGIFFLSHDERYRYSQEWIAVVKALWSGERVNFSGDYFHISDLCLLPRPVAQPHPRVYLGGESDPARDLAMKEADVFFLNGRPIEVIRETIADVRKRKRKQPKPLRFAMSAFVIARPTDAEAQENYQWLLELTKQDDRSELLKGVDSEVVMFKNMAKYPSVGSNGGTAAGLVGSYDTVAARIADFVSVGVDTFMLQFQPFAPEMRRFSQEVMPRVRSQLSVSNYQLSTMSL
ncbi:luciferase-like protein [Scytonema sp. HK-05]|uniref:LLM class flavin-dependent oxidoreductase n=1 Tax=Scytonema sp. HK-05 TaxID=1137095 RepID=UPI0009378F1C|nr:LLM class flavin-dependent oxidoreductase [Scytonema sp. HK-05]OKH55874.1 alkanesulfonate monooxygenase [Scytonema sp. HK-05]BAY49560.1 luciferase-like protein [Scytonema sp. HK-05]